MTKNKIVRFIADGTTGVGLLLTIPFPISFETYVNYKRALKFIPEATIPELQKLPGYRFCMWCINKIVTKYESKHDIFGDVE